MFDNLTPQGVEDIFAETDKQKVAATAPVVNAPVPEVDGHSKALAMLKKLLWLILILIVFGAVAYGVYWKFLLPKQAVNVINVQPVKETTSSTETPIVTTTASTTVPMVALDSDNDRLTDIEEKVLGTDSFNADTDADGLTDDEEVLTYKTDPLNPDSDADGYQDGAEVKGGYNPLGAGKLK